MSSSSVSLWYHFFPACSADRAGKGCGIRPASYIAILRLLVKIGMEVSSFILGALMLIVFGCIIFTIVQHTWNSMAILIVMEVFLVLITAGTGVIEGVLQMASESLGGFMRS